MGDALIQPTYPKNISFEQVWASLNKLTESQKDTEQILKKTALRQEETNRQIKDIRNFE